MDSGTATSPARPVAADCAGDGRWASSPDGTRVWYADTGRAGQVVLFLHGFSGSSSATGHFATRADAAGLRFVAPDLRGHGLSGKPSGTGAYDMQRFIEDFSAVADACGVERVHLVGHCLGGMVAVAVAAALPERVATLTLVATSLQPAAEQQMAARAEQWSPHWVRSLARHAFPAGTDAPPHVDYAAFDDTGDFYWPRMVADYRALSADTAFAIIERLKRFDLVGDASAVAAPALVVHGARDSVFPPTSAERVAGAIPGASLMVLPGHNHVSLVLRPDSPLFDAALDFVRTT